MTLQNSDLIFYGCQYMPQNNTDQTGGAIETRLRVTFADIVNVDTVEAFSTNATLNGPLIVIGLDANDDPISETITLDGETVVAGSSLFKNVWQAYYPDASHTGSIYLQDSSTQTIIAVFDEYETGVVRIFYNSIADYFGGSNFVFYEKIFIKNIHANSTLINAQLMEDVGGGLNDLINFGVENSFNSVQTIANRLQEPTGVASYSSGPSALVEGPNLLPGDAQGIWLKLSTEAGEQPIDSYYRLKITGRST